jgi:uncharacterized protein (DUF486 family)
MVEVISDTEPTVRFAAWKDELSALASGAIVGALTWVLAYLLTEYVLGMIACRTGSSIVSCSDAGFVSAVIGLILASVAGLTILVRRRIFRPLLVVLAAGISLWGVNGSWLEERSVFSLILSVIITALVYLVFAWFAKIRQFWIALIISVLLVIIFRLAITL